jgi:hypothetical protein
MHKKALLAGVAILFGASVALADLTPWEDYEPSDAVYSVTTVKVDSNMGDAYLEGLRETWIPGNKISKELGQIEDWWIYRSDLPESGDFNLLLVVKFANTDDLAPNKAEYDRFMEAFTQEQSDRTTEYAQKNYPAMRELTGQYLMREITIK